MRLLAKAGLAATAATTLIAAIPGESFAQLQQQPELVRRLWPFGRLNRPVPQLPQENQVALKRISLVAPFVVNKIDINSCSLAELQDLPGVEPSTGARILAGRPYRNFADLERMGIPLNVVNGLRGKIVFGP
jgi:DNA uptake protein ComE-like DNA-binding protein